MNGKVPVYQPWSSYHAPGPAYGSFGPVLAPYGSTRLASAKLCMAKPSCFRLFWHLARAAASRTFWTAGRSRPMRMAMMAITTNSSIRVNADDRPGSEPGRRPEGAWRTEGDTASLQDDVRRPAGPCEFSEGRSAGRKGERERTSERVMSVGAAVNKQSAAGRRTRGRVRPDLCLRHRGPDGRSLEVDVQ